MDFDCDLGRIRKLSDEALLAGLGDALVSGRQLVARVLAHLGEVEERRLHLLAGYTSMFAYCTARLKMSEDEACRRIGVARLARRFPILLGQIASGLLSLSVAALLEHRLTDENHAALLAAVSGKTIRQAREVLAAWFPEPDVPQSIRKLPEPRSSTATTGVERAPGLPFEPEQIERAPLAATGAGKDDGLFPARRASDANAASIPVTWANDNQPPAAQIGAGSNAGRQAAASGVTDPRFEQDAAERCSGTPSLGGPTPPARAGRGARAIKPLSPGRYRVQFTASAELTRKLELARDLLRHAVPNGDLASLIERAVDLLLEKTMQRRFGKMSTPSRKGASAQATNATTHDAVPAPGASSAAAEPCHPSATKSGAGGARSAVPCHRFAPKPENARASAAERSDPPVTTLDDGAAAAAERSHPPTTKLEDGAASAAERSHRTTKLENGPAQTAASTSQPPARESSRYLPAEVRRAVLERDGLRCTWRGPDGVCCESRAWLEHDHIVPHGHGGAGSLENTRLYCRSHNRLAAEQAYGKATIARMIARRQRGTRVRTS